MLDTFIRPFINRPLEAAGRALARRNVSANAVTLAGLIVGLMAACAIAVEFFGAGFALIVLNRFIDGLDGAIARATTPTDRGGFFDIVADYVFYASVPLAFAIADPASNALPAAAVLASFCLTASSFLGFAIIAAKRQLTTDAHGTKSFFYSTGLIEGAETILFFLLAAALPQFFAIIAYVFAALCVVTAIQRAILAVRKF